MRTALALVVLLALAQFAGAKDPADYRVVHLLGEPDAVGTIRVRLDDGALRGDRVIREVNVCVAKSGGFGLCPPEIVRRKRVDRGEVVRYSGLRMTKGPRRVLRLRATWRGDELTRFDLRYSGRPRDHFPFEMRRYGLADVTATEVLPLL